MLSELTERIHAMESEERAHYDAVRADIARKHVSASEVDIGYLTMVHLLSHEKEEGLCNMLGAMRRERAQLVEQLERCKALMRDVPPPKRAATAAAE